MILPRIYQGRLPSATSKSLRSGTNLKNFGHFFASTQICAFSAFNFSSKCCTGPESLHNRGGGAIYPLIYLQLVRRNRLIQFHLTPMNATSLVLFCHDREQERCPLGEHTFFCRLSPIRGVLHLSVEGGHLALQELVLCPEHGPLRGAGFLGRRHHLRGDDTNDQMSQ